ncbi:hypothetical protein TNCT_336061 [Trichonephila clavata]|uniref:Uncharacterized protein n=1 Tax=Trichonephila clavata TaxID=2740835 RepID=A0A8X6KU62_TRICU|nr:hypothetical protein TNCT_336061 [Trichonephila clavata]
MSHLRVPSFLQVIDQDLDRGSCRLRGHEGNSSKVVSHNFGFGTVLSLHSEILQGHFMRSKEVLKYPPVNVVDKVLQLRLIVRLVSGEIRLSFETMGE